MAVAPFPHFDDELRRIRLARTLEGLNLIDLSDAAARRGAYAAAGYRDVSPREDAEAARRGEIYRRHVLRARCDRSRRPTIRVLAERTLDKIEARGLDTIGLGLAIVGAIALVWYAGCSRAHAVTPADPGPTPSTIAGLLISLAPVGLAVVLMAFASCGERAPDEEPYGDTTGFGEDGR